MSSIQNYRDVGAALEDIGIWALRPRRLFRAGQLGIFPPGATPPVTILGLRTQSCSPTTGRAYIHHPFPMSCSKYDGRQPQVRLWLLSALALVDSNSCRLPLLIHCAKGTDRTGMLIAAILLTLKVPHWAVIREYSLSPGADVPRFERFLWELDCDGFGSELRLDHSMRFRG